MGQFLSEIERSRCSVSLGQIKINTKGSLLLAARSYSRKSQIFTVCRLGHHVNGREYRGPSARSGRGRSQPAAAQRQRLRGVHCPVQHQAEHRAVQAAESHFEGDPDPQDVGGDADERPRDDDRRRQRRRQRPPTDSQRRSEAGVADQVDAAGVRQRPDAERLRGHLRRTRQAQKRRQVLADDGADVERRQRWKRRRRRRRGVGGSAAAQE